MLGCWLAACQKDENKHCFLECFWNEHLCFSMFFHAVWMFSLPLAGFVQAAPASDILGMLGSSRF